MNRKTLIEEWKQSIKNEGNALASKSTKVEYEEIDLESFVKYFKEFLKDREHSNQRSKNFDMMSNEDFLKKLNGFVEYLQSNEIDSKQVFYCTEHFPKVEYSYANEDCRLEGLEQGLDEDEAYEFNNASRTQEDIIDCMMHCTPINSDSIESSDLAPEGFDINPDYDLINHIAKWIDKAKKK